MASVSLSLRKNKKGGGNIILNFNYGRKKKLRYSTKFKLTDAKNWINRSSRVRITDEEPEAEKINKDVYDLISYAETLARSYEVHNVVLTNDKIKADLDDYYKPKVKRTIKHQGFIFYYKLFIEFYAKNPRPKINKPYSKGTLRAIKNSMRAIEKFQKEYGYLEFKDITLDFHASLLDYLADQDYKENYKGTIIKNIKVVMNDAYEKGYHSNLDYKNSNFTKPSEEVYNIYLTLAEIELIANCDLQAILDDKTNKYFKTAKDKPTYDYFDRCRDFFLIQCHTGLRVSDTLSLGENNMIDIITDDNSVKAISKKTSKTSIKVELPIKKELQLVLEKYNNMFPKKVTDSRISKNIKKIAKACEIDEPTEKKIKKNGKTIVITVPKYDLISNHTARRSFCTNAYNFGLPIQDIMVFSGHKSEKTLYKYIKASPRDRFNKMKDHPFFK